MNKKTKIFIGILYFVLAFMLMDLIIINLSCMIWLFMIQFFLSFMGLIYILKALQELPNANIFFPSNSYHDVIVVIDAIKYHLFNSPYSYILECDRMGGWQLWYGIGIDKKLIGGEYNNNHFQIFFRETLIFDNKETTS